MRTFKFCYFFLEASLLAGVLAELNYTAKMTHHGVEVPVVFTPMPPRDTASAPEVKRRGSTGSSPFWAGAAQESPSSGLFHSISAFWQVPELSSPGPALTSATYEIGQWVGIDNVCDGSGVILQAGTAQTLNVSGAGYQVWFEWFPSGVVYVNIPITSQDWFFVNVTATSTTSGYIVIENTSQNYVFQITLTGGTPLCLQNAEWIVENPNPVYTYMPAPNFGTIWFESCVATTTTGAIMGIDNATMWFMDSLDGTVITSIEYDDTDFYVQY